MIRLSAVRGSAGDAPSLFTLPGGLDVSGQRAYPRRIHQLSISHADADYPEQRPGGWFSRPLRAGA